MRRFEGGKVDEYTPGLESMTNLEEDFRLVNAADFSVAELEAMYQRVVNMPGIQEEVQAVQNEDGDAV